MIESIIDSHIVKASPNAGISEPTNSATISNTTAKVLKKQAGESQLIKSQRYKEYKAEVRCPQPTQLQKQIKEAYTQLIEGVIEPLRVGR